MDDPEIINVRALAFSLSIQLADINPDSDKSVRARTDIAHEIFRFLAYGK